MIRIIRTLVVPFLCVVLNPLAHAQYFDEETELDYNWQRYYDPKAGRFVGKDPVGFAGGDVNLYGYVFNAPTNFIDPFGLYETDVHYHLTKDLAKRAGLSDIAAEIIATA